MINKHIATKKTSTCYHCGDECSVQLIRYSGKPFCCNGCVTVFRLLSEHDLCDYYTLSDQPGISPGTTDSGKFSYLDNEQVKKSILDFQESGIAITTLHIPQMHCASCIWLLENLPRMQPGILHVKVNFLKKEVWIKFREQEISLKHLVALLASVGYEPLLTLENISGKKQSNYDKAIIYKLGVAGFCFGNVMLLSFPEYFDVHGQLTGNFRNIFRFLSLVLSLPVVFYSGRGYITSAFHGIRNHKINLDVPIALGISALFLHSTSEVLLGTGSGYWDSLTGLIFFLLLGRYFQSKTYNALSFDRDYTSYFPISITRLKDKQEESVPVNEIKTGDRILVRNQELIPADGVIRNGKAQIDYSFVTGESLPVDKASGELVYAGGKQCGTRIELEVIKDVSKSYLTSLWNHDTFRKSTQPALESFANRVAKYFTIIVLLISFVTAVYWWFVDPSQVIKTFSSILIVACPCALALSIPFTYGTVVRIMGQNKFYLKDSALLESLAQITDIIFDKTGTLTINNGSGITYRGEKPPKKLGKAIRSLVHQSTHPVSQKIYHYLGEGPEMEIDHFHEYPGKGLEGWVSGHHIRIGSLHWLAPELLQDSGIAGNLTGPTQNSWISIDDHLFGHFAIRNTYREGLENAIDDLKEEGYFLHLISGDNSREKPVLKDYFGDHAELHFNQSPEQKLNYIRSLNNDKKTLMIGDGLNDAGALKESTFGISINENHNQFTPASDAILSASQFSKLPQFLRLSRWSGHIVIASFIISFLYNIIGLGFAVQGMLSPVVSAILMPLSSITVVAFTSVSGIVAAKKLKLNTWKY